jgi:hypothetical protein
LAAFASCFALISGGASQESTEQPAETIGETYLRALSLGELTRKVNNPVPVKPKAKGKGKPGDQDDLNVEDGVPNELPSGVIELVKLEVAWAGFMRRQEEGDDDMGGENTPGRIKSRCGSLIPWNKTHR